MQRVYRDVLDWFPMSREVAGEFGICQRGVDDRRMIRHAPVGVVGIVAVVGQVGHVGWCQGAGP